MNSSHDQCPDLIMLSVWDRVTKDQASLFLSLCFIFFSFTLCCVKKPVMSYKCNLGFFSELQEGILINPLLKECFHLVIMYNYHSSYYSFSQNCFFLFVVLVGVFVFGFWFF